MLRVGTLFSGGLAAVEFALRYENIDHKVIFACEFDKYARKQYLQSHDEPTSKFYNDVNDFKGAKYLNKIDLLVWGSPCQDLSHNGKRKGFNGKKSSLFRVGAKIQNEILPNNFIFENVIGLLSSSNGADYKEVISTFREQGYHLVTLKMNTKDYGVPQNRDRVFIVGFLDTDEYHNFKQPVPRALKIKLKDLLENKVDDKYYLSDKQIKKFMCGQSVFKERFKIKELDKNNYATCLDCREGGRRTNNFIKIKSATKKGYEVATSEDSINFKFPQSTTRGGRVGKGVSQTLDTACNLGVISTDRVRRLTPRETFRLQGVRDEDIKLINSDTQSYKISGNAISVNVIQELLKALYKQNTSQKNSLFDFMGDD